MAKTKTKINKLEKQVLLNETDALPVADTNMTIDGRYITEEEFNEMIETFDPNNLKVGWYIGHIWNFWMEKDKEPEKQGIIRDIEYKDGVLYVYSQDLNPEFLKAIESGKYTDLSIEAQRLPTENKIENEDGEEEQEYKWHLTGIAAVKTGAFSRYGLVEYKQYSINNISYKVINQPNFFQVSNNKSEVLKNMSKKNTQTKIKDEDQIDVVYTEPEDDITTTIDNTKLSSENYNTTNAYVDDLQKSEIKTKEEITFLQAQSKSLKNKIEDKNNKIDMLEETISNLQKELLKKDFMIFYQKGIITKTIQNKFMGFDDSVNQFKLNVEEDIYKSQLWRDYSSNEGTKQVIEEQMKRGLLVENISNNTNFGNKQYENTKPLYTNYTDNDLYEYAKNLALKETGVFNVNDIKKYLQKAQREMARR
jgi:hypothetical protein